MSGWDPTNYQRKHSFVWRYGADVVELLDPQPEERILDIGCGTGQLTAQIARCGAHVVGLDSSAEMIREARRNYPELEFVIADAERFSMPEPFDAVFSNAALHWVKNASQAAACIASALRPGGRFVAELGGKGNIASVQAALRAVLGSAADEQSPWFYPSIPEYSAILEHHGLETQYASLFDRPTPLEGENGIEQWLRMFVRPYFREIASGQDEDILRRLVNELCPTLYRDGVWTLDYRRLRIVAIRPGQAR